MLGAITADLVASHHEYKFRKTGGCTKDFDFTPFLEGKVHYSYITPTTIAVADSLIHGTTFWDCLQRSSTGAGIENRFCNLNGASDSFSRWLTSKKQPNPINSGSCESATRMSAVGLFAQDEIQSVALADQYARTTHTHNQAVLGATSVALAICLLKNGKPIESVRSAISNHSGYDLSSSIEDIRWAHRRSNLAVKNIPCAMICAFDSSSFEEAVRNAISLGGNYASIASIAGSLAEARFGIPTEMKKYTLSVLPPHQAYICQLAYDSQGHAFSTTPAN